MKNNTRTKSIRKKNVRKKVQTGPSSKAEQIIRAALNAKRPFTTTNIATQTRSSQRHTRRVLANLVDRGTLSYENGTYTN